MTKVQKRKFTLALNHYLQAKTRARLSIPGRQARLWAMEQTQRARLYRVVEELMVQK